MCAQEQVLNLVAGRCSSFTVSLVANNVEVYSTDATSTLLQLT